MKELCKNKLWWTLVAEAVASVAFGCCRRSGGRGLALFVVVSALTLCIAYVWRPELVVDCCRVLAAGALLFALFGVILEYELIPCAGVLREYLNFNPAATVYSVFSSAILALAEKKEKETGGKKSGDKHKKEEEK